MKGKVCILAAGVGGQLQELSKNIAPCILPVNFKASISYIIEKFDKDVEIVIAVGHKKETIEDYLALAYPDRKFTFVEVDTYMGPESSAGQSLLACKDHLQCPFVYFAADTIVVEEIPSIEENWLGVAPTKEPERYCTVKVKNNLIYGLDNKVNIENKLAFIGVAGIKDYGLFWDALENKTSEEGGGSQVNALRALVNKKLNSKMFTWFDTGSLDKYIETNKSFLGAGSSFDFSKNNEFLYFVNGRVIKFFGDIQSAKNRVDRAKILDGLCPKIEGYRNNFYSYKKVEGNTLYEVINPQTLKNLLHWANQNLWKRKDLDKQNKEKFKKMCKEFYYNKTLRRVKEFYEKNNLVDDISIINGIQVPKLSEILDLIDWDNLFEGIPARFHGDFTVGNILVSRDNIKGIENFTLLDWRHEFAGSIEMGDIYYDLAKLYKGIFLSDDLIKKEMFHFEMSGTNIYYEYYHTRRLIEAREEYDAYLEKSEFDSKKVKILSALCLINMSPLHNYPFNFLVYFLGKNILYKLVGGNSK
jgi:choline kinase